MRRYCICFTMVVLLTISAKAQHEGRAGRQYAHRSNVVTPKSVPKKKPAENNATPGPTEPEKNVTNWNPLWLQPFAVRGPHWESHYQDQLEEFWKKSSREQAPKPQPNRDSLGQYHPNAPVRQAFKANRQIVLRSIAMIGDPSFAAPIGTEQADSFTLRTWPAEKLDLSAPLPLATALTIEAGPPAVPRLGIDLPTLPEIPRKSLTTTPEIVLLPPLLTMNGLPRSASETPTSPPTLMIDPPLPTVFRLTTDAPLLAGADPPLLPTAPAFKFVPPIGAPVTIGALPISETVPRTPPTVNSPQHKSTVPLLSVDRGTPDVTFPPSTRIDAPIPPPGTQLKFGTTNPIYPLQTFDY